MGDSRHHEWTNGRIHHFAWNAVQLYHWTRLAICSITAALALAGMTLAAAAQAADSCKKLDDELVVRGRGTASYEKDKQALEAAGADTGTITEKARQLELDDLSSKSSTLLVKMDKRLS